MTLNLSISELLSDLSADATAIAFDMPDSGYDKLHSFIERRGILPESSAGRSSIAALLVLASRIVKQQLGHLGPVGNFLNELAEDGVREEAKRIFESLHTRVKSGARATDSLWEMDEAQLKQLLALYQSLDGAHKEAMQLHFISATARHLALLAGLGPDELALLLDITTPQKAQPARAKPRTAPRVGAVNHFFFPWVHGRRTA